MADSTIPGLAAIAAPLAAADLFSVRRGGQTRNEKAAFGDLRAALSAGGPAALTGFGTVTSVALSAPAILTVGGSPVTDAGTLALTLATQAANLVLAGPSAGGAVAPTFRALVAGDVPTLNQNTTGTAAGLSVALVVGSGGTGVATLTAHGVVIGEGAAAVAVTSPGTAGQVLTSNGAAADPTFQSAAGGVTNPLVAGSLGTASLQLVAAGDGLWQPAAHIVGVQANSLEVLRAEAAASAVNYLRVIAPATGGAVQLASAGTDAAPGITLAPKGNGNVLLATTGLLGFVALDNTHPALAYGLNRNGGPAVLVGRGDGGAFQNLVVGGFQIATTGDMNVAHTNVLWDDARAENTYSKEWLIGWANVAAGGDVFANAALSLTMNSPGVLNLNAGRTSDGSGWFNYGGTKRVAADLTNATAAFANITGLSATLIAGRFYLVRMVVKGLNSTATEGLKFDFNGGTATATAFFVGAGILASGGTDVIGANISTSLAGVINFTTFTGESVIIFEGYIQCNAAGTFIPRFAENTSAVGTATVRLGTYLALIDTP